MKKILFALAVVLTLGVSCSQATNSSGSYLSGTHTVTYAVTEAGTFGSNQLQIAYSSSPTTSASLSSQAAPFSKAVSMTFDGKGTILSLSFADTLTSGVGSITGTISIDGSVKYSSTETGSGANTYLNGATTSPVF